MQQPVSDLPQIKKMFYAMRNGIVADALRKQGTPFRMIYGVNIPQLTDIAAQVSHDAATAQALWDDHNVRECMLLAPMIYPQELFDESTAMRWITSATTQEAIDILCLRLLRHRPFAYNLAETLTEADSAIERYAALRIMFNLLPSNTDKTKAHAEAEMTREHPATYGIARALLDEIEFIEC